MIAGKDKVWCLYPNKNAVTKSVQDAFGQDISADLECSPAIVLLPAYFLYIVQLLRLFGNEIDCLDSQLIHKHLIFCLCSLLVQN